MKKSKFSETHVISAIKENEAGSRVEDISRELAINPGTFYQCSNHYSGMKIL